VNRKSLAAAALSIAAIGSGAGVPVSLASSQARPLAGKGGAAFSKQDVGRDRPQVIAVAAAAFTKVSGPESTLAAADAGGAFLKYRLGGVGA
jgi:hypothetical protein